MKSQARGQARNKDLAEAMYELERTRKKLQRSEKNGRESRQAAEDARRQVTATNKTLEDIESQETTRTRARTGKVALEAVVLTAKDARVATGAATTIAQTTAGAHFPELGGVATDPGGWVWDANQCRTTRGGGSGGK